MIKSLTYVFRHLKCNFKYVCISLLTSLIFTLLLSPIVLNIPFLKEFLTNPYPEHLLGYGLLFFTIMLLSYRNFAKFIPRYLNNFTLSAPPFTFFDFSIWNIFFLIILHTFWFRNSISFVSNDIRVFLISNLALFILFTIFVFVGIYKKVDLIIAERTNELDDEPINSANEDLLDRNEFVEVFVNSIHNLNNYDNHSVVLGLHGKWGEGKTSTVNLIKEKMLEDSHYLVVDFNPWQYKDEQAIISAFFYEIERNISDKYLFHDIKNYLRKYIKLISFGFVKVEFKVDLFTENEAFNKTKCKIQSYVNRLNKKLIIVIDDIDRLEFAEMQLIFKLVSLVAKFNNFVFVLICDNILIQKYLNNNNIDKEYLEKIIQRPIKLPLPEKKKIDRFLFDGIKEILLLNKLTNEKIDAFFRDFSYQYTAKIRERFVTLRNVKTYLTSLKFELPLVINEVNIFDFCLLLMLKVFSIKIYDDISKYPGYYIDIPISNRFSVEGLFGIRENLSEESKAHLDSFLSQEENAELTKYILCNVFPKISGIYDSMGTSDHKDSGQRRFEKRVSDHESFFKYFLLKVPADEIPDEYLESIIKKWNSKDE